MDLDKKYLEAVELFKSGNYENAILICENELYGKYNRKADIFKILNLMGHIYYKLNLYNEALSMWNEARLLNAMDHELVKNIEIIKKKVGGKI